MGNTYEQSDCVSSVLISVYMSIIRFHLVLQQKVVAIHNVQRENTGMNSLRIDRSKGRKGLTGIFI